MTRITAICATLMVVVLSVGLPANEAGEDDSLQSPSPVPETTALDSGQPIERRLARGEEHRYQLTLTSGEFASIIVEQRGIDVTVQGELNPADGFLANEVIPRCPSKYEMQQRAQNGETMPHGTPGSVPANGPTIAPPTL